METTITIQEPFSYSLWPIVLLFLVLCLSMLLFWVIPVHKKNKQKNTKAGSDLQVAGRSVPTIEQVKRQYVSELTELKNQYTAGAVTERSCYQKLSIMLRKFVSVVSANDITNMTLTEIQYMGMPKVGKLISEYYEPEFSREAKSDIEGAIERTIRVIEEWN